MKSAEKLPGGANVPTNVMRIMVLELAAQLAQISASSLQKKRKHTRMQQLTWIVQTLKTSLATLSALLDVEMQLGEERLDQTARSMPIWIHLMSCALSPHLVLRSAWMLRRESNVPESVSYLKEILNAVLNAQETARTHSSKGRPMTNARSTPTWKNVTKSAL